MLDRPARVAQLDRASASGAEGCGFDPRLAHQPSLATPCSCERRLSRRRETKAGRALEPFCCELRLGTPAFEVAFAVRIDKNASKRMYFYYVYILQSEKVSETFYVGFTEDLRNRLPSHNSGSVPHTAKSRRGGLKPQWHLLIVSERSSLNVT